MVMEAQYKTLYGIHFNHHAEIWGQKSFNKILVKNYRDDDLVMTDTTGVDSTASFLYPIMIKSSYTLNGLIEGHFKVYNSAGVARDLDDYTVTLKKINNAGNITIIAEQETVISGSYSIPSLDTVAFPINMTITKQNIKSNEKLFLHFDITGNSALQLSHYNDSSLVDIKIDLPIANMEGG